MRPLLLLPLLCLACAADPAPAQPSGLSADGPSRAVAVTVDDLPLQGGGPLACDADALGAMHARLLAGFAAHAIPATGFVNAGRVCDALPADFLAALLTRWLDAGHDLGNHTFSHPNLLEMPVAAYAEDVVRGEPLLRRLLADRGRALRYFRHPYLRTGETAEKKAALAAFLDGRGYTVAPVTIDSDEWVFAAAYQRAVTAGDSATAQRLRTTYLDWFDAVFAHYEAWSVEVLGYEPPQVLLLHANLLNSHTLGALAGVLEARGYRFVSLDAAMADPAYARPDPFVGRYGSSWLHRWARGQGLEVRWEPDAPDWVTAYYEAGR